MPLLPQDGNDAAAWWQRPAEAWDPNEVALAAGGAAVADARACVEAKLGYTCSAGIAPTKILAKLSSGLHKPRQQTVVCFGAITGERCTGDVGRVFLLGNGEQP